MNSRRVCAETRGSGSDPPAMGTGCDSRTFPETVKRTAEHGAKASAIAAACREKELRPG